jgi:hypothetical protein
MSESELESLRTIVGDFERLGIVTTLPNLIVSDLSPRALRQQLQGAGLRLRTGPVVASIRSRLDAVASGISLHYADTRRDSTGFADFHVSVQRPFGPRRWIAPQVVFSFDGTASFAPLPATRAFRCSNGDSTGVSRVTVTSS